MTSAAGRAVDDALTTASTAELAGGRLLVPAGAALAALAGIQAHGGKEQPGNPVRLAIGTLEPARLVVHPFTLSVAGVSAAFQARVSMMWCSARNSARPATRSS